MMNTLGPLIILMIFISGFEVQAQSIHIAGSLYVENCNIQDSTIEEDTLYNLPLKVIKLSITANSKVQMSCNYGDPSSNLYSTTQNSFAITYLLDSTGALKDSVLSEIYSYVKNREEWAIKYDQGSDFSLLPFDKSFFLSDSMVIPFIWSEGERKGDYFIYYVDNYLFKIELLEGQSLGSLSSFARQNMYFAFDQKRMQMGEYVKDLNQAKILIEDLKSN